MPLDLNDAAPQRLDGAPTNAAHVPHLPDLRSYIGEISRRLLGPPNEALSSRDNLRFGTHGSVSVEIGGVKAGSWYDNENGVGGGPLEMLRDIGVMSNGAALDWLK